MSVPYLPLFRQKVSVSKVLIHSAYKEDSSIGDIALLKLGQLKAFCEAL